MERNWKLGDDLHEDSMLLDGIDFDDIITALQCNEPVIDQAAVRRAAIEFLNMRLEDYRELLDNNISEIIKAALKRRN